MNEPAGVTQERMEELQDELRWNDLVKRTESRLVAAARRAKQQIAAGMAAPMDYNQL